MTKLNILYVFIYQSLVQGRQLSNNDDGKPVKNIHLYDKAHVRKYILMF